MVNLGEKTMQSEQEFQFSKKSLKLYLIIGDSNMGKSSVLRHLGAFTNNFCAKQLKFQIRTLAYVGQGDVATGLLSYNSLQEQKIMPQDFVRFVNQSKNCPEKIFVPLRLNAYAQMPDAKAYVNCFQQQPNWTIAASVVLNANIQQNGTLNSNFPKGINVYSTLNGNPICPTNKVADAVRKHFQLI